RKHADSLAPEWDSRAAEKAVAAKERDSTVPSAVLEREQALKRLFNTGEPADNASSSDSVSLENVFGLGRDATRPELPDAHRARMEEYKQMLGLPSQPVATSETYNPFASFIKPPDAKAPIQSGWPEGARVSSYNPLAPQLGAMTLGLSPGSLQDAAVKG